MAKEKTPKEKAVEEKEPTRTVPAKKIVMKTLVIHDGVEYPKDTVAPEKVAKFFVEQGYAEEV